PVRGGSAARQQEDLAHHAIAGAALGMTGERRIAQQMGLDKTGAGNVAGTVDLLDRRTAPAVTHDRRPRRPGFPLRAWSSLGPRRTLRSELTLRSLGAGFTEGPRRPCLPLGAWRSGVALRPWRSDLAGKPLRSGVTLGARWPRRTLRALGPQRPGISRRPW